MKHLKVENYKSLENLSLDIRSFMVFVGPNNSGKSNIFDALTFLSDFVKGETEARRAVQERGGFGSIVYDGDLGRSIRFEVSGTLDIEGEKRSYRYRIKFSGDRDLEIASTMRRSSSWRTASSSLNFRPGREWPLCGMKKEDK